MHILLIIIIITFIIIKYPLFILQYSRIITFLNNIYVIILIILQFNTIIATVTFFWICLFVIIKENTFIFWLFLYFRVICI